MTRRYTLPASHYAAAALRRGPLVREWQHWRHGRRRFNHTTVNELVAAGVAKRQGNRIVGRKQ